METCGTSKFKLCFISLSSPNSSWQFYLRLLAKTLLATNPSAEVLQVVVLDWSGFPFGCPSKSMQPAPLPPLIFPKAEACWFIVFVLAPPHSVELAPYMGGSYGTLHSRHGRCSRRRRAEGAPYVFHLMSHEEFQLQGSATSTGRSFRTFCNTDRTHNPLRPANAWHRPCALLTLTLTLLLYAMVRQPI